MIKLSLKQHAKSRENFKENYKFIYNSEVIKLSVDTEVQKVKRKPNSNELENAVKSETKNIAQGVKKALKASGTVTKKVITENNPQMQSDIEKAEDQLRSMLGKSEANKVVDAWKKEHAGYINQMAENLKNDPKYKEKSLEERKKVAMNDLLNRRVLALQDSMVIGIDGKSISEDAQLTKIITDQFSKDDLKNLTPKQKEDRIKALKQVYVLQKTERIDFKNIKTKKQLKIQKEALDKIDKKKNPTAYEKAAKVYYAESDKYQQVAHKIENLKHIASTVSQSNDGEVRGLFALLSKLVNDFVDSTGVGQEGDKDEDKEGKLPDGSSYRQLRLPAGNDKPGIALLNTAIENAKGTRKTLLTNLKADLGVSEKGNMKRVRQFQQAGGPAGRGGGDSTAWCMSFVQFKLKEASLKNKPTAWAKDGLVMGRDSVANPQPGDLVVVDRNGKGHIGFYLGTDKSGYPIILGGNQGNAVSIKTERRPLLGIRNIID